MSAAGTSQTSLVPPGKSTLEKEEEEEEGRKGEQDQEEERWSEDASAKGELECRALFRAEQEKPYDPNSVVVVSRAGERHENPCPPPQLRDVVCHAEHSTSQRMGEQRAQTVVRWCR